MSGDRKENARESDHRRSLAEQLREAAPAVLDTRSGRDGVGGKSFVDLVEERVPGVAKRMERHIPRVDEVPRPLSVQTVRKAIGEMPARPPRSADDALAREACAVVEESLFGWQTAAFRRHGCYDGDPDHRIALEAIRLTRERDGLPAGRCSHFDTCPDFEEANDA